ncbi:uncharacterized protein LOC134250829 [Saccostrea cucullata]|uniref:uncharacterized protein LOC134250829 n=1 Tax=Saccostrea cuccullata TaxID=36930 RepID=UPI002ED3CA1F
MNGSLEQECGSGGSWEKEIPYCKRCKCPCTRMKNQVIFRTQKQLQDKITAIQKKLVLEKKNLASQKNAKISVADPRPSAKAVGSIVGVGIIMFTFAIIVLLDLPVLYRHIRFGPRKKIKGSTKSHSKSKGKEKKNT